MSGPVIVNNRDSNGPVMVGIIVVVILLILGWWFLFGPGAGGTAPGGTNAPNLPEATVPALPEGS